MKKHEKMHHNNNIHSKSGQEVGRFDIVKY